MSTLFRSELFSLIMMIFILFIIGSSGYSSEHEVLTLNKVSKSSPCPPESQKGLDVLEEFLTNQKYEDRRVDSGTDQLTVNQIRLLTNADTSDKLICTDLNQEYSTDNMDGRETVYYEVGNFYFVIRPLIQYDEDIYIAGYDIVTVLDTNKNNVLTFGM